MKKLLNETKIIKWIIFLPIIGVILTSFILTNMFISSIHEAHNLEITTIEKNHINNLKEKIKERIENISLLLNNNYEEELQKAKASVKDIVNLGFENLKLIYTTNKNLPHKEIYKIIDKELKEIRFLENNGYFFVISSDSTIISQPSNPKLIGKLMKDCEDKNIYNSFKEILEKNKKEGYSQWYWNKIGSIEKLKKLGYIKRFEPLDIYIGTAIYVEDIKETISKNAINFIESIDFKDESYIFIINTKGTALSHKNKEIVNIPLEELSKKTQNNVKNIIEKATSQNGIFTEYTQSNKLFEKFKPSKKISYIKHIPILNWVIGTGLYTDNLNMQIKEKRQQLKVKLDRDIKNVIFVSFLVTIIVIIFLITLSKRLKKIFKFYSNNIEESNSKLKKLNNDLEEKVKKQVTSLRQKDAILNQQSKLAAMGEMLGNIAHQWRQPLSAISTLASGLRIKKELGVVSDKQLDSDLEGIVQSTQLLSRTIDDFRNFYSKDKKIIHFKLEDTLQKVLSLISANLKHHKIELIQDIQNIELNSYENELIQVLLNILNNAKDALQNIEDENKYIFINAKISDEILTLKIYDNGGGIKKDIINRIFEPYFTTKFKSQGTGIGLYMTKNIIDNSLLGKIEVKNKKFEYENKSYKGALFTIELPINK